MTDSPERFLRSADLARHLGHDHRDPEDSMAYDAVQGILNFDQLEAWIETEREVGPRECVMEWLREKNQELLEADSCFHGLDEYTDADRTELRRLARERYEQSPKADRDIDSGPLSATEKLHQLRNEPTLATDGGDRR